MLENGFLVDGKYKILDVIGRGGMSIVYLAINEKANRSWAVKELIRTDPRAAGISKKETDLLKKLHHPGIAGIVDVIEQKESQLIVMDYVEGHSLDQVLEEFDRIIGLERLKAIHINDSMNPLGSHKDRHAKIGEGCIGKTALQAVATHPRLQGLPFILETPNDDAGWAEEIAMLRETKDL